MKKKFIILLTMVMFFSVVGPVLAETVTNNTLEELSQPKNNTNLTDQELLNLEVSQITNNQEVREEVAQVDQTITDEELKKVEEKALNLKETELLIDEETLAYRDTINPDIDVQNLIQAEEGIKQELVEKNEVQGLFAAVIIRGLVTAVTTLFKKYGMPAIKATWHLAERMHERGVSPVQVFNAVTKGKKYYDPAYNSTVYYYNGVAVARQGNSLTTTYKTAKPKSRWR
ncbi:DUF4258 domain-containing protein [Bacillus bingmayongensis]|uniref:DUF4258 domain-containing protein n=1 Tax=Bacillus bingmayongensis TaxID=1150157 RepID=UPI001C8E8A33|nr:DUF4258 domain-containing protein [Bacillus bingmayongensis]MBY0595815.1 DUF4258 domain-containing protein [Bacillus bingmayongensis]